MTIDDEIKRAFKWRIRSQFHWQLVVDGTILDYWPTKSKWHHDGATNSGDVVAYIRGRSGDYRAAAIAFCELDAEQQAKFFSAVFEFSGDWSGGREAQWKDMRNAMGETDKRNLMILAGAATGEKQ